MAIGLAILSPLGCGGSKKTLDTVPVSGKITLDGAPVEGATVTFSQTGQGGKAATGTTDSSGRYKLTTRDLNDGALAGSHAVTIAKTEGEDSDAAIAFGCNPTTMRRHYHALDEVQIAEDVFSGMQEAGQGT